jgi:hypothetical protein
MIVDHDTDPYAIELRIELQQYIRSILYERTYIENNVINTIYTCLVYAHKFIGIIIYETLVSYINEEYIKQSFGYNMLHHTCRYQDFHTSIWNVFKPIIDTLYALRIIRNVLDIRDLIAELGSYRF